MLDFALPALHHHAAHLLPACAVFVQVSSGEMQVLFRHAQPRADAIETQLAVCPLEAQRVGLRHRLPIDGPFIHAPEMRVAQVELQLVDHPRHQGELLGRPNRPTDPRRAAFTGLIPRRNIFQRLSQVKILQRVVKPDLEARASELQQVIHSQARCVIQDGAVEGGVVPPLGGDFAQRSHSLPPCSKNIPYRIPHGYCWMMWNPARA